MESWVKTGLIIQISWDNNSFPTLNTYTGRRIRSPDLWCLKLVKPIKSTFVQQRGVALNTCQIQLWIISSGQSEILSLDCEILPDHWKPTMSLWDLDLFLLLFNGLHSLTSNHPPKKNNFQALQLSKNPYFQYLSTSTNLRGLAFKTAARRLLWNPSGHSDHRSHHGVGFSTAGHDVGHHE